MKIPNEVNLLEVVEYLGMTIPEFTAKCTVGMLSKAVSEIRQKRENTN